MTIAIDAHANTNSDDKHSKHSNVLLYHMMLMFNAFILAPLENKHEDLLCKEVCVWCDLFVSGSIVTLFEEWYAIDTMMPLEIQIKAASQTTLLPEAV
eukprot:15366153-Ditylum_brightwellii.AAC.1